nr:PQQ-binding-like beta-propeller repeat protein [Actinomycetales bacterium]
MREVGRVRDVGRRTGTRSARLLAGTAIAALALAACSGGTTERSTAQNVLELAGPPGETIRLTAADFVGTDLCPEPLACTFTSATWADGAAPVPSGDSPAVARGSVPGDGARAGEGGAQPVTVSVPPQSTAEGDLAGEGASSSGTVVAVVQVFGELPGYVTAGRPLEGGAGWRTDILTNPHYCVSGPGPTRVACMVEGVTPTGGSTLEWRIFAADTGEVLYETDARVAEAPPVVTQVEDAIYAVWPRYVAGSDFLGTVEAFGPDGVEWSTELEFALTDTSRTPLYVLHEGDRLVLAEAVQDGRRVTLDPQTGAVVEGREGMALAEFSGRALGSDGGRLLVGDLELAVDGLENPAFTLPYAWTEGPAVPVLVRHSGGLAAFSSDSGEVAWELEGQLDPLASCGETLVLRSLTAEDAGRVLAVDAGTGEQLWSVAGMVSSVVTAWCAGEDVVVQDQLTLMARSLDDGAEAWTYEADPGTGEAEVMTLPMRPTFGSATEVAWWIVTGDGSQGAVVVVR